MPPIKLCIRVTLESLFSINLLFVYLEIFPFNLIIRYAYSNLIKRKMDLVTVHLWD